MICSYYLVLLAVPSEIQKFENNEGVSIQFCDVTSFLNCLVYCSFGFVSPKSLFPPLALLIGKFNRNDCDFGVTIFRVSTLIHDDFAQELIDINNEPSVTEMIKSWKTPGPEILDKVTSPRHIKTHLPFKLLPPALLDTCKVNLLNYVRLKTSWRAVCLQVRAEFAIHSLGFSRILCTDFSSI